MPITSTESFNKINDKSHKSSSSNEFGDVFKVPNIIIFMCKLAINPIFFIFQLCQQGFVIKINNTVSKQQLVVARPNNRVGALWLLAEIPLFIQLC